ncbi:RNA polymerase factor sigma-54 [Candidatus Desantisbacteria bacterium]|nr:RNA polymerase factor sigma-54 [Candidatus Desantisbacteria bacterium]
MQQNLKQIQETRLIITQKLQQAIDLLQLSNLELVQKIEQEMVTNPVLEEVIDIPKSISLEMAEEKIDGTGESKKDDDALLVWKDHLEDDNNYKFNNYEPQENVNYEDFTTRKQSLNDHLLWQLSMTKLPYHEIKIAELIIGNLNQNGYFVGEVDKMAQSLNISSGEVEKVLKLVQKFDPIGVAARDLKECLLIQAKEMYPMDRNLHRIIENHFEELGEKNFANISKILGISIIDAQKYFEIIKSLEPKPGRQYSSDTVKYIIPDIIIEKEDDKFIVIINDDYLPQIRINQYYKKILQKSSSGDVKKYLKEKMDSAAWLLNSISQRKNTMYKVVTQIVEWQKDFFDKGILFLKPLALKDIASVVEMNESTISRITTNKYAQTPMGIFELKYFFIRGMQNDYGEDISTARIKEKIKTIIENEDGKKPASDNKIAEMMKIEGLNIARRTIAKYREEMNIHSSAKRKKLKRNELTKV